MPGVPRSTLGIWLLGAALLPATAFAQGTFKGGKVSWQSSSELTIEFSVNSSLRRDAYSTANNRCINPITLGTVPCSGAGGYADVGDVIVEAEGTSTLDPGDGSAAIGSPAGPLLYVVISSDAANNVITAMALDPASLPNIDVSVSHTYPEAGVYRAFLSGSLRMAPVEGTAAHINNGDQPFRVETLVNVGATTSASPLGGVAPIVLCAIDAVCSFPIGAFDTTEDGLQFRLSQGPEAGYPGSFTQPGPPHAANAASIDPVTGVYSWDTRLAPLADPGKKTFYSTQVTIESLSPAITGTLPPVVTGVVPITETIASKLAIDFLIQLVAASGTPPEFESGAIGTHTVVRVGERVSIRVRATDADRGQTLTMNAYDVPAGASFRVNDERRSSRATASLQWRPSADQVGDYLITFAVNDSGGRQRLGSLTITVVP